MGLNGHYPKSYKENPNNLKSHEENLWDSTFLVI